MGNVEKEKSILEIQSFVVDNGDERVNVRGMTIPPNFSFGAIKEILSQIVWGVESDNRCIAYFPKDAKDDSQARLLSTAELRELRKVPHNDRMAFLDYDALQIKTSPTAMIVKPE